MVKTPKVCIVYVWQNKFSQLTKHRVRGTAVDVECGMLDGVGCIVLKQGNGIEVYLSLHSQVLVMLVMLVDTSSPLVVHSLHYVCTLNIWHNECSRGASAQTAPQAILQLCPPPLHSAATVLILANINYLQSPPLVDCRVIPLLSALISTCSIITNLHCPQDWLASGRQDSVCDCNGHSLSPFDSCINYRVIPLILTCPISSVCCTIMCLPERLL